MFLKSICESNLNFFKVHWKEFVLCNFTVSHVNNWTLKTETWKVKYPILQYCIVNKTWSWLKYGCHSYIFEHSLLYTNGQRSENHSLSLRTSTDLVMRIELTRVILLPRLSDLLKNSIIDFHLFFILVNMFPNSHRFIAMLITRSNNFVSTMPVLIYSYLIREGRRNCSRLWPA